MRVGNMPDAKSNLSKFVDAVEEITGREFGFDYQRLNPQDLSRLKRGQMQILKSFCAYALMPRGLDDGTPS